MKKDHPARDVALKTGDRVHDFELLDTENRLHILSEALRVQTLVLVFYRGDW